MNRIVKIFCDNIILKPRMNLLEWSEKYRILSRESSANYGKFKAMSYQREPMEKISDNKTRKIVLLWASQLGKSEMINNTIGYYITQEPSTILFVLPNEIDAEDYSKRRLAPMFRDTPSLLKLINDKDANNTILIKNFKGGNLALVGSNSVSKLASKPIRILLVDECDRCEATKEGDAVKLAEKRTITFNNRKIILSSTPTLKGSSRIINEFENSDQRYFYVPCPACGYEQILKFENIVFQRDENNQLINDSVFLKCVECGTLHDETTKNRMVQQGVWRAKNPNSPNVGYFLNALYSPFYTLKDIVNDFLDSKDNQSKIQTFINTIKAQAYEPPSVSFSQDLLINRCEDYTIDTLPNEINFITAGVDIQDNRIEINFAGFASGLECYNIAHITVWGHTQQATVWDNLYKELTRTFTKLDNSKMQISIALIDSGFNASKVYEFCNLNKRFVATKGLSEASLKAEFINPIKLHNSGCKFTNIGTFKGKSELFRLLSIKEHGDGYMHFSSHYTQRFFDQLTAEKLQKITNKKGYDTLQWVKIKDRNEAIDLCVLNLAGAKILNQNTKKRVIKR